MQRDPLTKQRSPWTRDHSQPMNGIETWWWNRRVHDGTLWAAVAEEPHGWHLSISFRNHRNEPTRYPTWDEIAHVRDELLPPYLDFVMWLPKTGEYLAVHPTTFHIHEHPERTDD